MGIVLSTTNLAEQSGASITVSSETTGLGPRAMFTPQIQDFWRSGTWNISTTVSVTIDLGSLKSFRLIAIAAPRDGVLPPSNSTLTLTASAFNPNDTDALNLSSLPLSLSPWGVWGWRSSTSVAARYVKLTFNYGGIISLSSYVQLGRLWIGDAIITEQSYAYGQTKTVRDPGINSRSSVTGIRYATRGKSYRVERLSLPFLTESEATALVVAADAVGTTGQIFFAREEEYLGEGMFGHFIESPSVVRQLETLWTTDFQIEEDA